MAVVVLRATAVCCGVQRGIGAHSFEELQQRAAAIKNKKAVNVIAKKPAEAILEVLATPDQTPGPTPNKSTASSRNNSGCLDGSDEAPFSASAHVSSLEAELNCESPRGPSSSFLEDEHLQVGKSDSAEFIGLCAFVSRKCACPAFIFCKPCSVPARRR